MNKYVLSLLFLLAAAAVFGQSKSKVELVRSTFMQAATAPDGSRILKVRNGTFKQDYSTLTSDSAYFYTDLNVVDAFSHVVINQGDTVHIYSDKLNYNGNTKTAVLTNHVVMVDKDATLTTDNFTYNTATRIGTYVDGGKLVNKETTVISKNGYYFANSRDAYFRYDVVANTPDAVIKTDTMRYNAGTRINYFYGPTIITGKDKDNLYTENGTYNTATQQAFFGKKNLYVQKTKTLRGDSLFYDRKKGYGKAVNHVTFTDSEQRITLKGDLGEFYKANEEAVVTRNAYMIFVTEDSSGVKKTTIDSTKIKTKGADSLLKTTKLPGKDTLTKALDKLNKALPIDKKITAQAITDSVNKNLPADKKLTMQAVKDSVTKNLPAIKKAVASNGGAIKEVMAAAKKAVPALTANIFPQKTIPKFESVLRFGDTIQVVEKPRPGVKYDSLYFVADTLRTQVLTFKDFKIMKQKMYDAAHPDTSIKAPVKKAPSVMLTKLPKYIVMEPMKFPRDTAYLPIDLFGKPAPKPKPAVVPIKIANTPVIKKMSPQDSIKTAKAKIKTDSLEALKPKPKVLSDTSRIRIVSGYHAAKLFKSDLQAKADSMFYSSSDSTIRMFVAPMIWTQGAQLTGDSITLQMKNKKLDNLDMYPNGFIVHLEKKDSTVFNQAGGKRMHGTFKNGKLNTFLIIGNAETIYFKRDTVKNIVTDMSRTVSGTASFTFENGEIVGNGFSQKYEGKAFPINKVKEDDKILKGFIWKPKERPISKEAILNRPKAPAKKAPAKTSAGKQTGKPSAVNAKKDSLGKASPQIKTGRDSLSNGAIVKPLKDSVTIKPGAKLLSDSLSKKPVLKPLNDSLNKPAAKPIKDSLPKDTVPQRRSVILKP
ncbi:MAG: OstA-like protein [Bacteroidota bacterium]